MSIDIYFFKNGFDIQKSRAYIAATCTKLQAIKDELEQLEDDFEEVKLSSLTPPNRYGSYEDFVGFCLSGLHNCHKYPDAVIEAIV